MRIQPPQKVLMRMSTPKNLNEYPKNPDEDPNPKKPCWEWNSPKKILIMKPQKSWWESKPSKNPDENEHPQKSWWESKAPQNTDTEHP